MRAAHIDIPAVGVETTARAESHSRGVTPQRRRTTTAQISSSRRAKRTTLSPLRPSRLNLGAKYRAQIIPSRRQGLNDDSKKQLLSRAQIPSRRGLNDDSKISSRRGCLLDDDSNPSWWYHPVGARNKRRRCYAHPPPDDDNNNNKRRKRDLANPEDDGCFSGLIDILCPPHNNNWRDWANLADGPAGLIADRVLASDVADYVRFRAVCRPWRQCSTEPRSHSGLDRRFHPWRWTMLREKLAMPDNRCFLNTSTGQCVQVNIPELHDHELLAVTPEGLLVMANDRKHMCLLNPLTRHRMELPPLTTLLPPEDHHRLSVHSRQFYSDFIAWGSGIVNDDSTFVLCLNRLRMIGMAKPGDDHWTFLKYRSGTAAAPVIFAGRLYCVTLDGLMVLETGADKQPRLDVAAKMDMHVSSMLNSVNLVNNCCDLLLVYSCLRRLAGQNDLVTCYDTYRVDLDTGTLFPVKSLGGGAGRAVFMGFYCSLSVSLDVFPSGSISADTIYLISGGNREATPYHLVDGSSEDTPRYKDSMLPRPHTPVQCLSLLVTQ